MLGADITAKTIRTLCNFKKMDKIYMLILVSMDLQLMTSFLVVYV